MSWWCYIAVKAVQEDMAREVIQMTKMYDYTHHYGDFTVFRFTTQCIPARQRLSDAKIPFAAATYFADAVNPRDSWEVYYDREGVCHEGPIVPIEDLKTLWYRQIHERQALPNYIVYRMAHILAAPNDWGDVKHNTAMARMRQALLS